MATVPPTAVGQEKDLDFTLHDSPRPQSETRSETADPSADDFTPMPPVLGDDVPPLAKEAFAKGQQLLAAGDIAGAVSQFSQAVEFDPSFAQGYLERGRGLRKLGQDRLAVKSLSRALSVADDAVLRAVIYYERGAANYDVGEYQKALDDLDRAAEFRPGSADVAYQRGRTLVKLAAQEYAAGIATAGATIGRAIAAFDRAIDIRPEFADALADRGEARAGLGEIDEAIDDLTQATKLRPDDRALQFRLAIVDLQRAARARNAGPQSEAQRATDLAAAIALLQSITETAADDQAADAEQVDEDQVVLTRAVARIELATLVAPAERAALYESALADCDAVIKNTPRAATAHFQRGVALRLLGKYREAVAAFTEALRLAPENTEARIRRGITWFYLEEYDLAMDDFRGVGLLTGDPRPSFWIGVIHAQRGDHLEAIRAYTEALDENPRYRLALVNRSLSLMHLGHFQRAIDDLNRLIQLNPGDAQAYRRRGLAQQRLGREEEAQRSFAKARSLGA